MNRNISHKRFQDINLNDNFFDSLRDDYNGFDDWFVGKGSQDAYVQYNDDNCIEGFLYLKKEEGLLNDIQPAICANRILKVGTFKINAHGTRLGEQFVKIIMDRAI